MTDDPSSVPDSGSHGKMIAIHPCITAEQREWLRKLSKETGAPVSFLVRKAIEIARRHWGDE